MTKRYFLKRTMICFYQQEMVLFLLPVWFSICFSGIILEKSESLKIFVCKKKMVWMDRRTFL